MTKMKQISFWSRPKRDIVYNGRAMNSRYLDAYLRKDLAKKLVLLSGPRQAGKTTLAKRLAGREGIYLNWDIRSHQRTIRQAGWPKDAPLVVLDELHKYLRWKNFLKGLCDEFGNRPPLLVTGSARLETLRHGGDALTGRYYSYRLHPVDLSESRLFLDGKTPEQRLSHLLMTGGFPEALIRPSDAERLRNDRFDQVLNEDLRDIHRNSSIRGLKLLIELLRERTGGQLSYARLADDIGVSPATVKSWLGLLEQLFVIFLVYPYSKGLARSLRKEPKFYFYDCAASYNGEGAALENAVACSLLKWAHLERDAHGRQTELRYFRDKEKREVDFVVVQGRRPLWCIEAKTGREQLSPSLAYLHERLKPAASFQLVRGLGASFEMRGVKILPLVPWLDSLNRI